MGEGEKGGREGDRKVGEGEGEGRSTQYGRLQRQSASPPPTMWHACQVGSLPVLLCLFLAGGVHRLPFWVCREGGQLHVRQQEVMHAHVHTYPNRIQGSLPHACPPASPFNLHRQLAPSPAPFSLTGQLAPIRLDHGRVHLLLVVVERVAVGRHLQRIRHRRHRRPVSCTMRRLTRGRLPLVS